MGFCIGGGLGFGTGWGFGFKTGGGFGFGAGCGLGAGCGFGLGGFGCSIFSPDFDMSSTITEKSISFVLKHVEVGFSLDCFLMTNFCRLDIPVFSQIISRRVLPLIIATSSGAIPL